MSVHYKFVLDKRRKRADQIYTLKLRIYDSGGNKEKSLSVAIHETHWDDAGQTILPAAPNYKANNYKLNSTKTKIEPNWREFATGALCVANSCLIVDAVFNCRT